MERVQMKLQAAAIIVTAKPFFSARICEAAHPLFCKVKTFILGRRKLHPKISCANAFCKIQYPQQFV